MPNTRAFCLLALSMGEGTDGGLPGQRGRLQLYLTTQSLPWGSSTGNATGEVEVLARGAAVDSPSTLRSLMERRLSASQHRGKMRHAVLAVSQRSHDRRRTSRFRLRNAPFRAVVVVGLPWGEEDQEDLLHHQRRSAAPARQLFSDRRKGFSENPNVFSEKSNFLASLILPGWAAERRRLFFG